MFACQRSSSHKWQTWRILTFQRLLYHLLSYTLTRMMCLLKEDVIFTLNALVYSKSSTNIWKFILTSLPLFHEEPKLWFLQCWVQFISITMNVMLFRSWVLLIFCSVLRFWLIFFGTYVYLRDVKFTLFSNSVFFEFIISIPFTDAYHLPSLYSSSYSH